MSSVATAFQKILNKKDRKKWVNSHRYPIQNRESETVESRELLRDVPFPLEGAFSQNEEWLRESQSIAGIGTYSLNIQAGRWCSSYFLYKLLGIGNHYERSVEGWKTLVHPEDRLAMAAYFAHDVVGKGLNFDKEYRIIRQSDGEVRWVHGKGRLDRDDQGRPWRMRGTIQEITERKQAEMRLQLAASVFTNAQESILITSADGTILDVNEKFSQMTGYSREEVVGRNPRLLQSGQHDPEFYSVMWRSLKESGQWSGEIWNRSKSGRIFPQMLTISSVRDNDDRIRHYVALAFDVTAIKEREGRLVHLTRHDPLTGLPNRAFLADRLNQAMAHSRIVQRNMAVAYLDLDSFKTVNDTYGHAIGDHLLKVVAKRMQHVLREGDTLARLGGDEFVVVLLDIENADAGAPVIARLLEAVAQPMHIGPLALRVSSSVGITFYAPTDDADANQLLHQADQAMYESKLSKDSRFCFFDSTSTRSHRGRHDAVERMHRALDANEFKLHYQPKVNMRTGEVVGVEALVRWQHPDNGLMLPDAFLPAIEIENDPLEVSLGEWVIDTALTQLETWQNAGSDLPISVNIDVLLLQQSDFTARLGLLLEAHPDVDPSRLELEILETGALMDVIAVSKTLDRCMELGVSFALDDFGAGHSSLTYIKQLPARVLKIDQSFARDILTSPEDLAVLDSILRLVTAFGRKPIAEGVESVELGSKLLCLGCEVAQGYGISRPMSAEHLPEWMAQWRIDPAWMTIRSTESCNRQENVRVREEYQPLSVM